MILYRDNTQVITVSGVTDSAGNAISNAMITGNLLDNMGRVVDDLMNQTFTAVTGTPGSYTLTLTAAFAPPVGNYYQLLLTGVTSMGNFELYVPVQVQKRALGNGAVPTTYYPYYGYYPPQPQVMAPLPPVAQAYAPPGTTMMTTTVPQGVM